jgi:hypothetical protein
VNKWFDQNTVSKICIVPHGKELSILSESIDPANIPHKYGGDFKFSFGMHPELDSELHSNVSWAQQRNGQQADGLPQGPMRWVTDEEGSRSAIAVGVENGMNRRYTVLKSCA